MNLQYFAKPVKLYYE